MTKPIHLLRTGCLHAALATIGLWAYAHSHAQDTFYAHFTAAGPQGGGILTPSGTGSFYGATSHNMLDRIYCYKLDAQANLVWMKEYTFPGALVIPTAISTLSDLAFAFVVVQFGGPDIVCKVSDNGDMLWTTTLYESNGGNFVDLAPTTDGGLLLTGGGCAGSGMILHLAPLGNIISQHGQASLNSVYQRPNARKVIHEGNDQYAYLGHATQLGGNYSPMTFSRSDSAGNVYSYREIHFPYGISSSSPFGETIVRSSSGGHFLTTMVNDTAMDHVVLCYLDEQDDMVWFKEIATPHLRMTVDALTPTADGGCVLMGSTVVNLDPYLYHTYAIKFNEQGDMMWSKMFGDIDVPLWDRLGIQTVIPAGADAFMAVPVRWSQFDFCKLDNAFNGYCYEQPFAPIINSAVPTVIPNPITLTTVNFVEASLTSYSVPTDPPRSDLCASFTGIEEMGAPPRLTLVPDPASNGFLLYVPLVQPQDVEVSMVNSMGATCFARRYHARPDQALAIYTGNLSAGAYHVVVRTNNASLTSRMIVER